MHNAVNCSSEILFFFGEFTVLGSSQCTRPREEDTEAGSHPFKFRADYDGDSSAGSNLLDSNTTTAKVYTCHLCQFRLTRRFKRNQIK